MEIVSRDEVFGEFATGLTSGAEDGVGSWSHGWAKRSESERVDHDWIEIE